jgi:hypothetical protein
LAREENIALLAEAIGLDLEVEAQERNVGPFRADILCKDTATDGWVLIENQLERTDHTHLGQLLTYAAGLSAVTIVWVASSFTDEHRATLDWLNEITDDRFNFFGLEIELWRIGDSPVAPKFNLVCRPNDWSRSISDAATRILPRSETQQMQLDYWTTLRELLVQRRSVVRPQKALPQHWTNFAIGRSFFHLAAMVNTRERRLSCGLILTGPDAKAHFRALQADSEAIEREMNASLEWRELPDKKESRVLLRREDADPTNRENWPEQHRWLADKLELFHHTFSQRIRDLDAGEMEETEDGQ